MSRKRFLIACFSFIRPKDKRKRDGVGVVFSDSDFSRYGDQELDLENYHPINDEIPCDYSMDSQIEIEKGNTQYRGKSENEKRFTHSPFHRGSIKLPLNEPLENSDATIDEIQIMQQRTDEESCSDLECDRKPFLSALWQSSLPDDVMADIR